MDASPSSPTRSSAISFAWNAIYAGHVAHGAVVKERRRIIMQKYDELASLSDRQIQQGEVTAKNWVSFWGRESKQSTWQDEALGSGTPLVCLYLLGYYWGTHPFGLIIAAVLFILPCWGAFSFLTLAHGDQSFWDMWMGIRIFLILSTMVFFARIAKGTPSGIPLFSADVWVGLCLETLLANTLTCTVHVVAVMSDEQRAVAEEAYWIGRFMTVMCPFGLWLLLNNQAKDIQVATFKRQNMAMGHGGGRGCVPSYQGEPHSWKVVERCLVAIIKNSRDLRVTGLSREQLEFLAEDMGSRKVADYIRFFTSGGREYPNAFNVLWAFYQGYTYESDRAGGYKGHQTGAYNKVREWINDWLDTQIGGDPLEAINTLSQATETQSCSDALAAICPVHGQAGQNRWLYGLVAKVCDDNVTVGGLPRPPDGSDAENEAESITDKINHQFFALVAAALTVNRNPLTVLQMGNVKNQATEMLKIMEIGCEQVLRQTTDKHLVYIGRGLVLSVPSTAEGAAVAGTGSSRDRSSRVVTYSMGEVWQAEQRRETVMIGKDSFNRFWRGNGILNPQEKLQLLRDSVEWSKKVLIHVDYGRAFASLGPEGRTLVNVRTAARQGWCTHTLWVALSIYLHFYFKEHLFALAVLSIAVLALVKADQYAQLVYIGCRLWRSYAGRICLFVPPMMDKDVDFLLSYLFWVVIVMVNLGGAYLGTVAQTPIETALFLSLILGSIVPGLWYCVLCEDKGAEGGRAVVSYVGRNWGDGYRHRDDPKRFRPLGKDVLEQCHFETEASPYPPESGKSGSMYV